MVSKKLIIGGAGGGVGEVPGSLNKIWIRHCIPRYSFDCLYFFYNWNICIAHFTTIRHCNESTCKPIIQHPPRPLNTLPSLTSLQLRTCFNSNLESNNYAHSCRRPAAICHSVVQVIKRLTVYSRKLEPLHVANKIACLLSAVPHYLA